MLRQRVPDAGITREAFFGGYAAAVDNGTAAVFAGAGLSRASGYVDWNGLLREFAKELGLDIDIEQDLVAIAQYHINANNRDRSRLNQLLVEEFSRKATITPAHNTLVQLPIRTFWTTNYDQTIEGAMEAHGRRIDVKTSHSRLTTTQPGFDAILYKMHGDISDPENIIITRDDYEKYSRTHNAFMNTLQADLVNKTLLFLGFSFTDPNLDYILGQLRSALGDSPRMHFTIMRREQLAGYPSKRGQGLDRRRFEYATTKQRLRVADLQRYGIHTVLVDEYSEIPELLQELKERYYRRNIFVSGAAVNFDPMGTDRLLDLCRTIGKRIVSDDYNLVSGFGLGVGSAMIMAALEELYQKEEVSIERHLKLRPFPQTTPSEISPEEFIHRYRTDMIVGTGFIVFIAGNKTANGGEPVVSSGVLEEFQIAREHKKYPIPIAVTGWAARQIWEEVNNDFASIFPAGTPRKQFARLADTSASNQDLVNAAFELIHHLTPRPPRST